MPVVATVDQWRAWAADAIQALLDAEGAATQPGMEAKLSDRRFEGIAHKIDPHHLTTARSRLLEAGVIERSHDRTRGQGVVTTYVRSDPTKLAQRAAGRKRLLHARFMSWNSDEP